jgi:hypothetical protein
MLNLTTDLYQKTFASNASLQDFLQRAESTKVDIDKFAKDAGWFRGRNLFQLDVNYRWSNIVLDERFPDASSEKNAYGIKGQFARAGDRAPDAPALSCAYAKDASLKESTRLFDLYRPDMHIALVFADGLTESAQILLDSLDAFPKGTLQTALIHPKDVSIPDSAAGSVDFIFEDVEGHAYRGYGITVNPAVAIVRPDAMIGLVATGPTGVEQYLSKVFSGKNARNA